jgi:hypothetical protein
MFRGNSTTGVGHGDDGIAAAVLGKHRDPDQARALDRLHRIQQKIKQHLMHLIAVMVHFEQYLGGRELDLDRF